MRRTTRGLFAGSLVGLLLIAGVSAGLAAAAKIQLSVTICCEQVDRAQWLQDVSAAYMKENPNVEITPLVNAGESKVVTLMAAGVSPDLIWTGQSWGDYSDMLLPLNEFFAKNSAFYKDLVPGMVKGFSYNGKNYAIPFSATPRVFSYNIDMFNNAGMALPTRSWTWDSVITMGKRFTRDVNGDGSPETWGLAVNWQPWNFFAYGGDIYKDNGRNANLRQDVILKGARIFQDLWSGTLGIMPSGYAGESTDPAELFSQGKMAMWDIGIFEVPYLRERAQFDWNIEEYPQLEYNGKLYRGGAWNGEGYALYKDSKNVDEALKFAKFMLSREWLSKLVQTGAIMPASQTTLQTAFLKSAQKPTNMKALINSVDYQLSAWAHPAFGLVMKRMFQPIWNTGQIQGGYEPVDTALEASQNAMQAALDEFYATHK